MHVSTKRIIVDHLLGVVIVLDDNTKPTIVDSSLVQSTDCTSSVAWTRMPTPTPTPSLAVLMCLVQHEEVRDDNFVVLHHAHNCVTQGLAALP
jgi:hypothetical protein